MTVQTKTAPASLVDEGLRSYMLSIYNYMTVALGISGVVAYGVSLSPELTGFLFSGITQWIVMLSPLAFIFFFAAKVHKVGREAAKVMLWIFSALMGLSLSVVFIRYTGTSIVGTFFITASTFAAMSLYGYTTKRNLSGWGSFLVMGLIGLIIAMIVNIFLQSSLMGLIVSAVGVIIFTGLTAYDTQKLKDFYIQNGDAGNMAVFGALDLYLDFVNLFMFILHFVGIDND